MPDGISEKSTSFSEEEPPEVKSTQGTMDVVKAVAKLALKTVNEVSDAFPPLKCVAAGLSLIVENVEACVSLFYILLITHVVAQHI
jgi:hypothetical protein